MSIASPFCIICTKLGKQTSSTFEYTHELTEKIVMDQISICKPLMKRKEKAM